MQFWVYILRCADGSYYTGHTDDLQKRLVEHQRGLGSDWTKRRLPVQLVWCEPMPTRLEALEAEHRIKPWSRAKKEGLIARDWARVSHFARPPLERPSMEFIPSGAAGGPEGLGTNANAGNLNNSVRAKHSTKRVVEVRYAQSAEERPSTSLGTNEFGEQQ